MITHADIAHHFHTCGICEPLRSQIDNFSDALLITASQRAHWRAMAIA